MTNLYFCQIAKLLEEARKQGLPNAIGAAKMSLARIKATFERFGKADPMYAVLTRNQFKNNKGDPNQFFQIGRDEIAEVLAYLGKLGKTVPRGKALDFGCGLGRLSQALAEHFAEVEGVDIAASMVDGARSYNKHGQRVRYRVNTVDNLQCFPDNTFDFIYSNFTLQHIPPEASTNYIREFGRVLRPKGFAVFQVPSGTVHAPGSLGAMAYRVYRHHLRPLLKRMRGRHPVEIHYVPQTIVSEIVEQAGCTMVEALKLDLHRREDSYQYCFSK